MGQLLSMRCWTKAHRPARTSPENRLSGWSGIFVAGRCVFKLSSPQRVQIKFPPTRLPAYQSRASRPHVQKNCVSIRDWGSAAKSGCRTTIRSGGSLARGERFCEPLDTGHPKISAPAGAGGLKISWQIPRQASLCLWKGAMTNAIDTSELELPYRLQYQESRTDSGGIMACRTACLSWRNSPRPGRRRPCLADVLRDTKTGSSRWIHETMRIRSFAWQEGYGAVTVSPSDVPRVRRYIASQTEHHRKKTFQEEYREILVESGIPFDERYLW